MSNRTPANAGASPEHTTSGQRPTRHAIGWLAVIGTAALLLLTAGALLGRIDWRLELCAHFRVPYLLAGALVVAALAWSRRWVWLVAALVVVIVNGIAIFPQVWPVSGSPAESPQRIRVLVANVHAANSRYADFLELVNREQPDLIAVIELNDAWQAALEPLAQQYPHQLSAPRPGNFGMGLFSRLPLEDARVITLGSAEVPSLAAGVQRNGDRPKLNLLVTHPLPPTSARNAAWRDEQLRAIAEYAAALDEPVLVAGDLNVTPWSPRFSELLSAAKLHDARHGHGLLGTWPAGAPAPLRLPIDHVLTRQLRAIDLRVGPNIGSDHRPLVADLVLNPPR